MLTVNCQSVTVHYGEDFAAFYNQHWCKFGNAVAPLILDWTQRLGLGTGHLLDLCCGTGSSSRAFIEAGWRVTGVDLSAAMISLARQRNLRRQGVDFVLGDVTRLPIKESLNVDLTMCLYDSLNHLADFTAVHRAIAEAARHTRSGGWFVFDLNTETGLRSWQGTQQVIDDENGTLIATGSYDDGERVGRLDVLGYRRRADGNYKRFTMTQVERAFAEGDVRAALRDAGWQGIRTTRFDDLDATEAPATGARRIVFVAQRAWGDPHGDWGRMNIGRKRASQNA